MTLPVFNRVRRAGADAVAAVLMGVAAVMSYRIGLANFLLLGAGAAAWVAWRQGLLHGRPTGRNVTRPLAVFAGLTMISAVAAVDPLGSLQEVPRLLVFLTVPVAAAVLDERRWPLLVGGLAFSLTLLGLWGILEYAGGANHLDDRIHGPLSHYMTYSGWVLVAVLVVGTHALLERRPLLLVPVVVGVVALLLSYTRNAWVGLALGVLVLAAVWRRRLLLVYPLLALAVWFLFPRSVVDRAVSTFDLTQHANYDRLCMAAAAGKMIQDHPWTGVGPGMVKRTYPLYRVDDAPTWSVSHLHNNPLQIAAERGLPALAAYVWLVASFTSGAWRALPSLAPPRRTVVAAGLVAFVGITAAGLFEYNFWDAEIFYLTLPLLGAAAGRIEEAQP